ncbi:hypothetical protein B0H12DRAFT_1261563 [Mycena haematopus]|nr:hypothetical protein B0H12DRAFT_1261563 [Mycena haematopus]
MQSSPLTQIFFGDIFASDHTIIGSHHSQGNEVALTAQFAYADAGLKSAEDLIQMVSKLENHKRKQNSAYVGKILTSLEQVMNVLGCAAEYDLNAKCQNAITSFISVLKLELDRRDNDETIVAASYHMASMMNAIRPLGTALQVMEEAEMRESLTQYWEVKYYRGAELKERISNFIDTFEKYKENIRTILARHKVIEQDQMAVDVIKMKEASQDIINRLDVPGSHAERQAKKFLKGTTDVHELSPKGLAFLGKCLKEQITSTTILTKIDKGPHDLIDEPEIKEIWKGKLLFCPISHAQFLVDAGWKVSIKTRAFIDGLCTHYTMKLSKLSRKDPPDLADNWTIRILHKVTYYQAIGEAIDDDSSGFVSVHEINEFLKMKSEYGISSIPVWIAFWAVGTRYLDYLYMTQIMDTTLELKQQCGMLKQQCGKLENRGSILNQCLHDYLDSLEMVDIIMAWTDNDGLEDLDQSTAFRLRAEAENLKDKKEKIITQNLERLKYQVEEQNLPMLAGSISFRLEHHIMVLLCLILRKQHEILKHEIRKQGEKDHWDVLASKIQGMDITLWQLIIAFHERFKALQHSWRSQKLDINLQIQSFSWGLFSSWYNSSRAPNSKISRLLEDSDSEQYTIIKSPVDEKFWLKRLDLVVHSAQKKHFSESGAGGVER